MPMTHAGYSSGGSVRAGAQLQLDFPTLIKRLFIPRPGEKQTHLDSLMETSEDANFQVFRDCLSNPLIEKSSQQPPKKTRKARVRRKTAIKPVEATIEEPDDAEELSEFIDVCPGSIRSLAPRTDEGISISRSKSSQIFRIP
jgi:hypothetical protein